MAASERGCCVPRCGKTRKDDTVLHSFPNPDKDIDRYLAWTRAVGLDTSLDPHCVYRNRRVCHAHFELKFLTWTRRLSPGAIPTLLIPGSEIAGAPLIDTKNMPENVSFDAALPSTSRELDGFSNVCRICASITDQTCPVFGEQGQCEDLAMKINKYLPINVSPEDGLPQVVCEQCRTTLVAWHELVQCCVRADAALRQTLHNTDNTKPDETVGSSESPTQIGQTLISVKIENDCVDKHCNQEKEDIMKPEKIVTKDGKRYAVCVTCNKKMAIASWRRHLQSHSTVKRYSCHVCGLGFNDSGNLSRHRKAVHAEQRPYTCTICQKSFSRNSHLQEHIRTHYENRDYICDACGNAFKSNATLRMHKKIHADEYRFRCMYCESKFRRKSELLVHISVHTGEKSHSCGCGKAFRLRSQLRNHTRTHIKEIRAITQELE